MAQQKPHYTQYILNNYILNPALSGIENYTDIKLSHRQQWVGLADAPVTTYFTAQTPLGLKPTQRSATSIMPYPEEDESGYNNQEEYSATPRHHGVGVQIIQDKWGPFSSTSVMGTYAYHIGIGARTSLSAGVGIGFSQFRLDPKSLFFGVDNPVDPAVGATNTGNTGLDVNAGLWLYSDKYFVGVAAHQLTSRKLAFSTPTGADGGGTLEPHFFATAGYRATLTDELNIIPSVMIKRVSSVPLQVEMNAKLQYQNLVWVGASYRGKYGFAGMAGLNLIKRLTVSYSYDYSTTILNTVSRGTHEIMLGIILKKAGEELACPKNLW